MDRRVPLAAAAGIAVCCLLLLAAQPAGKTNGGPPGDGKSNGGTQNGPSFAENSPELGFLNLGGTNKLDPDAFNAQLAALRLQSEIDFSRLESSLAAEAGGAWDRAGFFYINGAITGGAEGEKRAGFKLMATVSPAPQWKGDTAQFESALKSFVRANPYIKYWQLGNEPDLMTRELARQWTPESYAEFFLAGEKAIRSECSDCRIILAGISNQYDSGSDNVEFYRKTIGLIKAGGGDFDIFDLHFWKKAGEEGLATGAVTTYKALLNDTGFAGRRIWVTEVGTYTGEPRGMAVQTEEQQMEYLIKSFALLAAEDVKVIMWGKLIEHYKFGGMEGGYFDHTGLVYDGVGDEASQGIPGGTKKKAFQAYKEFARRMQGVLTVERVAPTVIRFARSGVYFYIAWGSGTFGEALKNDPIAAAESQVRVTGLDGNEKILSPGSLQLTDSPVFVDPAG